MVDVGDLIEGDGNFFVIGVVGIGEDQIEFLESGVGFDGGEMGWCYDIQVDVGDVVCIWCLVVDIVCDVGDVV